MSQRCRIFERVSDVHLFVVYLDGVTPSWQGRRNNGVTRSRGSMSLLLAALLPDEIASLVLPDIGACHTHASILARDCDEA